MGFRYARNMTEFIGMCPYWGDGRRTVCKWGPMESAPQKGQVREAEEIWFSRWVGEIRMSKWPMVVWSATPADSTHASIPRNTHSSTQACAKMEPMCSGSQCWEGVVKTCAWRSPIILSLCFPFKDLGPKREDYFLSWWSERGSRILKIPSFC